jgi:hypothetical protein
MKQIVVSPGDLSYLLKATFLHKGICIWIMSPKIAIALSRVNGIAYRKDILAQATGHCFIIGSFAFENADFPAVIAELRTARLSSGAPEATPMWNGGA